MANTTYGAIKLSTADKVSRTIMKKTGSQTGYKPSEWADEVNLMGLLPIRTASGSIAHFEDGADDVSLKSLTAQILPIQEGTGDPSPLNVRPIRGTSVLNVTQNASILNLDKWCEANGVSYTFSNATFNLPTVQGMYSPDYRITDEDTELSFKVDDITSTATNFRIQILNEANQIVASLNSTTKEALGVTGCKVRMNWSSVGSLSVTNLVCYKGSSVNPNTTTTVNLGRTVYGGTADVVGGTGESERVVDTISDSGWSKYSNFFYRSYSDKKRTTTADEYPLLCSMIQNGGTITSSTSFRDGFIYQNALNDNIYIVDSSVASIDDFYVKYGGCQICYELATPSSFTFEGEEINSYLGMNNIWADSGDVEVEYRADIDLLLASLEGNRGLQMTRSASPVEEEQTEEVEENEDER